MSFLITENSSPAHNGESRPARCWPQNASVVFLQFNPRMGHKYSWRLFGSLVGNQSFFWMPQEITSTQRKWMAQRLCRRKFQLRKGR